MAAVKTSAARDGDDYVVNGRKMFITNGRYGSIYAIVCKTDPHADPPHRGISILLGEKGPGLDVVRDIPKLGYRGVETTEIAFEDYRTPPTNLLGGTEGEGFRHVMGGLELGRINVAARSPSAWRAPRSRPRCSTRSSGTRSASPSRSTRRYSRSSRTWRRR